MNILRQHLINSSLVQATGAESLYIHIFTLLPKYKLFSLSFEGIHEILTQNSNINCFFRKKVAGKYQCYFVLQSK